MFTGGQDLRTSDPSLCEGSQHLHLADRLGHKAEARPGIRPPHTERNAMLLFQKSPERMPPLPQGYAGHVSIGVTAIEHTGQPQKMLRRLQATLTQEILMTRIDKEQRHHE